MYKIITKDQEEILAEKPTFVRIHSAGCFVVSSEEQAEGVVVGGTPYLYADGNVVCEVDAADVYVSANEMAAAIREGVNQV